jgi:hypothetical protein
VSQSLSEVLTDAARAARETSDWERDQEAWNLPRSIGTEPRTEGDDSEARSAPKEGEADSPDLRRDSTE